MYAGSPKQLFAAASSDGSADLIAGMLAARPQDATWSDAEGTTALMRASAAGEINNRSSKLQFSSTSSPSPPVRVTPIV